MKQSSNQTWASFLRLSNHYWRLEQQHQRLKSRWIKFLHLLSKCLQRMRSLVSFDCRFIRSLNIIYMFFPFQFFIYDMTSISRVEMFNVNWNDQSHVTSFQARVLMSFWVVVIKLMKDCVVWWVLMLLLSIVCFVHINDFICMNIFSGKWIKLVNVSIGLHFHIYRSIQKRLLQYIVVCFCFIICFGFQFNSHAMRIKEGRTSQQLSVLLKDKIVCLYIKESSLGLYHALRS